MPELTDRQKLLIILEESLALGTDVWAAVIDESPTLQAVKADVIKQFDKTDKAVEDLERLGHENE